VFPRRINAAAAPSNAFTLRQLRLSFLADNKSPQDPRTADYTRNYSRLDYNAQAAADANAAFLMRFYSKKEVTP